MVLWILVLVLYVVHSCCDLRSDSINNNSNYHSSITVLKSVVGKIFKLRSSTVNGKSIKVPSWLCHDTSNDTPYEGFPLRHDIGIHVINKYLYIIVEQQPLAILSNQCKHRWPTILALQSPKSFSTMSSCSRRTLFKMVLQFLPQEIHFLDDVTELEGSTSTLLQVSSQHSAPLQSALVFFIGCGSIFEPILPVLKILEQQTSLDELSHRFRYPIKSWMVADVLGTPEFARRHKRSSRWHGPLSKSSLFYLDEKRLRLDVSEGQVIIEASGAYDEPYKSEQNITPTTSQVVTPLIRPTTNGQDVIPKVAKSLGGLRVFVGSKIHFYIPPGTFYDRQDGYGNKMTLKVFIRSSDTPTNLEVPLKGKHWIYYIPGEQVIVLEPTRRNVGRHGLLVCAYNSRNNRVCDSMVLSVQEPERVTMTSYLSAPSGLLWKYSLPGTWSDSVKSQGTRTLQITVDGDGLYEWIPKTSTINIVTEASKASERTLTVTAENSQTGGVLILSLLVKTSGHNPFRTATSVQMIIMIKSKRPASLDIVDILKRKVALAISRQHQYATHNDIIIYKVITGRGHFLTTKPSITMSLVYAPVRSITTAVSCSEVVISQELLRGIQSSLDKLPSPWTLEYVKLGNVVGKCSQDLSSFKDYNEVSSVSMEAHRTNNDISYFQNKTLNITVRNGFIFKKFVIFPFQPEYKIIQRMELLDENNLLVDDSSWVSLSTSDYTLFGLPLLEHVRRRPYDFRLEVFLKSGASHSVRVHIEVLEMRSQFDHTIEMIIGISESDTMARMSSPGSNQILISDTLTYRWLLVQTLGRYLDKGTCDLECGARIFTHSIVEQRTWSIKFSWSIVLRQVDQSDRSMITCDLTQIQSQINSLYGTDSHTLKLSNQAKPSDSLIKVFMSRHLGVPISISTIISTQCSTPKTVPDQPGPKTQWINVTVHQGEIFVIDLVSTLLPKDTNIQWTFTSRMYFPDYTMCNLSWLGFSNDGNILYGLPLIEEISRDNVFLLGIFMESGRDAKVNASVAITVSRDPNLRPYKTHLVNMVLRATSKVTMNDINNRRIKVVQAINQYLHPSCNFIRGQEISGLLRHISKNSSDGRRFISCMRGEDVILDSWAWTDKGVVSFTWSQRSLVANDTHCNVDGITELTKRLFENIETQKINDQLLTIFNNSYLDVIVRVELCLYGPCVSTNGCIHTDQASKARTAKITPENEYMRTIIMTAILASVVGVSISVVIYVVKRKKSDGDRTPSKKIKNNNNSSPVVSKKSKKLIIEESSRPSLTNNNTQLTPLLPSFSKEDCQTDRYKDSSFNNEDNLGSYRFVASRPISQDLDRGSSTDVNMTLSLEPQTSPSGVIRNPALMMGGRLNPYRNIPPPIK